MCARIIPQKERHHVREIQKRTTCPQRRQRKHAHDGDTSRGASAVPRALSAAAGAVLPAAISAAAAGSALPAAISAAAAGSALPAAVSAAAAGSALPAAVSAAAAGSALPAAISAAAAGSTLSTAISAAAAGAVLSADTASSAAADATSRSQAEETEKEEKTRRFGRMEVLQALLLHPADTVHTAFRYILMHLAQPHTQARLRPHTEPRAHLGSYLPQLCHERAPHRYRRAFPRRARTLRHDDARLGQQLHEEDMHDLVHARLLRRDTWLRLG